MYNAFHQLPSIFGTFKENKYEYRELETTQWKHKDSLSRIRTQQHMIGVGNTPQPHPVLTGWEVWPNGKYLGPKGSANMNDAN